MNADDKIVATTKEDTRVAQIVANGPRGALFVTVISVVVVFAVWVAFYIWIFLPRGKIG